jgi:hypothetical protein
MRITKKWLEKNAACKEGVEWFLEKIFKSDRVVILILRKEKRFAWASWVLVRLLNKKNRLKYAIYCIKLVISIYEKKYPNDKRLRQAIIAAKKVLKNNIKENRDFVSVYVDVVDSVYVAAHADIYTIIAHAVHVAGAFKNKIINYGLRLLNEN